MILSIDVIFPLETFLANYKNRKKYHNFWNCARITRPESFLMFWREAKHLILIIFQMMMMAACNQLCNMIWTSGFCFWYQTRLESWPLHFRNHGPVFFWEEILHLLHTKQVWFLFQKSRFGKRVPKKNYVVQGLSHL